MFQKLRIASRGSQHHSFNLLKFYPANETLRLLDASAGKVAMHYADDSIITYAQLDLSTESVGTPCPHRPP